jgi:hypothetical protein
MDADDRLARVLAYVDGELSPAEVRAFEAEMARDPDLAREVEDHRALAARVAEAFAPVVEEPVPAQLAMSAQAANDRRADPWLGRVAGIAAALIVGVIVGRVALAPRGDLVQGPAGLIARGELADGLTTKLAAEPGPIKVGLTFKDTAGRYCRTFQSAADRLAGLACRQEGRWRIELATAWTPAPAPQFRTAGSDIPAAVLAAVDERRAGDPLDAQAERAARDAGWR